jgi:hypothetical protein
VVEIKYDDRANTGYKQTETKIHSGVNFFCSIDDNDYHFLVVCC